MRQIPKAYERTVVAGLLFVIAVALVVVRNIITLHSPAAVASSTLHTGLLLMGDFQRNVYFPVTAFLHGVNPYDRVSYLLHYPIDAPFPPYLPSMLLLHLPFGLLPLPVSALLYFLLLLALVLVLAAVSLEFNDVQVTPARILLVASLIVLSLPGRKVFLDGQATIQAVLATYVALYYARRAPAVSGLGLALSMFKPSFGLPLAVLMLARRDVRAVLIGAGLAAVINLPLIGILVHEAGGLRPLIMSLVDTYRNNQLSWANAPTFALVNNPAKSNYRVDLVAVLSRVLGHPLGLMAQLLIAVVVLGTAAWALRVRERTKRASHDAVSTSIICIAMLLSVYHHGYDLLLLTQPAVALASSRLPDALRMPSRRWAVMAGLFAILALNVGASNSALARLHLVDVSRITDPLTHVVWLALVSINGVVLLSLFIIFVTAGRLGGTISPGAAPAPPPARASTAPPDTSG